MWKLSIKTNWILWSIFSFVLFIVFGSFVWDGTTKSISYWEQWGLFFTKASVGTDFYFALIFGAFLYAIPAIVLGWLLMALVQATMALSASRPTAIAAVRS